IRREQRLLKGRGTRDVGYGGALADDHAQADAAEIGAASRRDPAGRLELAHQWRRRDDEVGRLARGDDLAQPSGRADGEPECVAGLTFVVADQGADDTAHRAGGNDLELGGMRNVGQEDNARQTGEHTSDRDGSDRCKRSPRHAGSPQCSTIVPTLVSRFRSSQYLAAHSDANFGIKGTLVSRFRSSQYLAAHSDANFGIKGTLASLCF